MSTPRLVLVAALAALLVAPTAARAGDTRTAEATGGIQWFATWKLAKAEAARTQRPILLTSAAPHCRNISGMW